MNKQELEQKIARIERELAELKSKLAESDQIKIWQPKEDKEYWHIGGSGIIRKTKYCQSIDNKWIDNGNYFKTKEEAEKQAEYNRVMNRFRKYVEAYSEPLDWNSNTEKYFVYYDCGTCKIEFDFMMFCRDAFQIYASSKQILKDAILYSAGSEEEFIRIVFGGENGNNSDSTRCS